MKKKCDLLFVALHCLKCDAYIQLNILYVLKFYRVKISSIEIYVCGCMCIYFQNFKNGIYVCLYWCFF